MKPALILVAGLMVVLGLSPSPLSAQSLEVPTSVVVDPGSGLTNTSYTLTVSGGVNVTNWQVTGLTNGPDLDFGYYDYLQFQLTLPVGYTNALMVYFGTTNTAGLPAGPSPGMPVWDLPVGTMNYGVWVNKGLGDTNCVFMVPGMQLVADGTMHTYRLELGLIQCWRDRLHDLQIRRADGGSLTLGSVLVGDPGPEIPFDPVIPGGYAGSNSCLHLSSKHATVWWDTNDTSYVTNALVLARHTLRMTEESWNVYVRLQGFIDPCAAKKCSITTFYGGGTWDGGASWFNIPAFGAGDEGAGNPVPHEFGHATDAASPVSIYGTSWESHANLHRFERNLHFWKTPQVDYPGATTMFFETRGLSFPGFQPDYGTLIYHDWRYILPLNDYGSSYGLGTNGDATLWTKGSTNNEYIPQKLAELLPNGTNKTVACQAMMRWPYLDFASKNFVWGEVWSTASAKAQWLWQMRSGLIPQPDKPGWWRVPESRAPEAWGFMVHELVATPGSTVTVTLRGYDLPYANGNSDWRWGMEAVTTNDVVRYSPVAGPGTQSFTLNSNETKLLLVVVATPTNSLLDLSSQGRNKAIDKQVDWLRYAYEVNLSNATPATLACNWPVTNIWAAAPNGGGMVESTAHVDATAYVGPNAKVLGSAQVLGNAKILDYATVAENAVVKDSAIVSGSAVVRGAATVSGEARVRDHALVKDSWFGPVTVSGRATVSEYADLESPAMDDAIVRGVAAPQGGAYSGTVILDYNYGMANNLSDGVQFSSVAWDFGGYMTWWMSGQTKPRGLVASYRTMEPSGELWLDEFGAQQAFLRGAPARPFDTTLRSPVLSLNGTSQYAVLDRNVADSRRFTFSIWVNPADAIGTAQPIFFDGASATKALSLVRDASGHASLSISDGTTTQTLVSTNVLPANQWTHVAFTLDHGSSGTLFVNGMAVATGAITLTPVEVLSANDGLAVQAVYIGRDWSGNLFHGLVDDARFYNVTRSDGEVREEMFRRGDKLAAYSPETATYFDGVASTAESGVRNGKVRTLAAWVKPANVGQSYGAIFDSYDESSTTAGSGLAVANGQWVASLDNVGTWNTGVAATGNVWQHVALAFDGTNATFFLNGVPQATLSYSGPADDVAATAKCYRIGYSQTSTTTNYFNGYILAACVYDRALTAPQLILNTAQQVYTNASSQSDAVQADCGNDPLQPAYTSYTADSDGDGMPDVWELQNGFNPHDPSDAAQDADGDGFSNLAEYRAGTNPHDANSVPWGATISVNYEVSPSSTPPEDPTATAGVAPFSNWNNLTNTGAGGLTSPTQTFYDNTGAAVTGFNAMASSTAAASWNTIGDANAILFGDFALAAGGTLTLTNVPYTNYSLIVYFSGWSGPNVINYTIGTQTQKMTNTVGVVSTFTPGNNYVILTNLTASKVALNVSRVSGGTVGIAAFQVASQPVANTNTAPTLSSIADQLISYNTATAALPFTVGDVQTPAGSLVVTGSSSDTNLFPNGSIVLGGSGANRTVTATPATNKAGTAIITLTVSDGNMATSRGFVVTVSNNPPTISSLASQTVKVGTATAALPFTVGDVETPVGSLTVSGSSGNTNLVPNGNIVFGGSGANRTVTVTPTASYIGQANITLSVSDGSALTSTSFQLVVTNAGSAISVNYDVVPSSTPAESATALAGAVAVTNWNNIASSGTGGFANPAQIFYDNTGAAIAGFGVSLSDNSGTSWNSGGDANANLFGDWALVNGGTVTFASIPYANYDLYVYFTGWGGPNVINYTIGSTTRKMTNTVGVVSSFTQGNNYVVFTNLAGSGQAMNVALVSGGTVGLAAFQIVNHPMQAQAPATPTGLSATAGNGQVVLSWTASSGATSYNLKRATVNGGPYTTVTNVVTTAFTNTGLANGTTYYYVVSALNAGGESGNSTQASAMPQAAVPAAPTGLTAVSGNAQAALSWTASSGATSYNVKRATVNGGPYTTVTNVVTTAFTNTGLANGTTYYYVVSALNANGESGNSTQASVTPSSLVMAISVNYCQTGDVLPTTAVAGAVATNNWNSVIWSSPAGYAAPTNGFYDAGGSSVPGFGVKLSNNNLDSWNSGDPNQPDQTLCADWAVSGGGTVTFTNIPYATYDLYVYFNGYGGSANVVNYTINGSTQTLTDSTNAPWQFGGTYVQGTDYVKFSGLTNANPVMTVAGVSGGAYGLAAFQIVSHTMQQAPATPTGLSATAGNAQAALSWTASSGATSYNVKRSTVNGGPYTTITNVATTAFTDTGLANGTTYYYVVSALNAGGESANSTQASSTPTAPPAVPTGLVATAGTNQVSLSWSAVSGATSYNVKRATVNGGPYTTIASPTVTSYLDANVVAGTTYYYVVSAVNVIGESANSAQVSATPIGYLPSPWQTQDLGVVGLAGSADYTNVVFTIRGAGTNISGTADAFRFVYQSASADCSNTVRVATLQNVSSNANCKAGVMIRESLTANAREAGIWLTPTNGLVFTTRSSTGGSTTSTTSAGKVAPYWLRIARVSNSFRAYYSTNGTAWTQLGANTTINMATSTYIGMGVESGVTNTLNAATMDNTTTVP